MKYQILNIIFAVFLINQTHAVAQENDIDVSGKWQGTYSFMGKSYPMGLEISQNDKLLSGFVYSLSDDPEEYYKYSVEGNLKYNKVFLTGKEFLHKTGLTCMAKHNLKIIKAGDQLILDGKWGANLRAGGCLPGASGKVNLQKQLEVQTVVISDERSLSSNESNVISDAYTREMIKGLKNRSFHALIIGIDNYKDPTVTDLDNPTKDGLELKNIISNKYSFKEENISFLKNPTRIQILDEMERLSNTLDEKDNLLVFYAGHGYWDENLEQGYWLPADASLSSKSQWISNATIRDYIRGINSQHTLLIADACFSGGLLKSRGVGKAMISLYNMPSRKAITSGTLTTVPDKSVFIKYLIKYLDENQEILISADQIFYKIKVSVMNNSPNSQVPQYGPIHQANDEGGEFVFLKSEQ